MGEKSVIVLIGPNSEAERAKRGGRGGDEAMNDLRLQIISYAESAGLSCDVFQTNWEGSLVDKISSAQDEGFDAGIINAASLSHYSYAIRDAVFISEIPFIEVHTRNIYSKEGLERKSVVSEASLGQITGFGVKGYFLAMQAIKEVLA